MTTDETDVDAEAITAWAREIEAAAAQIPESEHRRFIEALAEHKREAKEYMRRVMGSTARFITSFASEGESCHRST